MYDLDLKHGIIISNVPSYSPETIAEYSVSIALQLVRRFRIEKRVQEHISNGLHLLCLPLLKI